MKKSIYSLLISLGLSTCVLGCSNKTNEEPKIVIELEDDGVELFSDVDCIANILKYCIVVPNSIDIGTCCSKDEKENYFVYLDEDNNLNFVRDVNNNGKMEYIIHSQMNLKEFCSITYALFENIFVTDSFCLTKMPNNECMAEICFSGTKQMKLLFPELKDKVFLEEEHLHYKEVLTEEEAKELLTKVLNVYFYNPDMYLFKNDKEIVYEEAPFSLTLKNNEDKIYM